MVGGPGDIMLGRMGGGGNGVSLLKLGGGLRDAE